MTDISAVSIPAAAAAGVSIDLWSKDLESAIGSDQRRNALVRVYQLIEPHFLAYTRFLYFPLWGK